MSALRGLASRGVPVVNEAHPYPPAPAGGERRGNGRASPAGQGRAAAWPWDRVRPAAATEVDVPVGAEVVVVGDRVFGAVPGNVDERSRRLTGLATEHVLGIELGSDVAGH